MTSRSRSGRSQDESAPRPARGVAYIIGTYPLLTTTFIDREIQLLRSNGLDVTVTALRRPHGPLSPEQQDMARDVHYVLPVTVPALLRSHLSFIARRTIVYWRTLAHLVTRPHRNLRSRCRTLLHFGEGVHVAHLLRSDRRYGHLHAHFVDRAATVALVAGRLLDLPFSATAHANDIYVDPVLLPEKLAQARFVVTCTEYNAAHLEAIPGDRARREILCIHHGLDLDRHQPSEPRTGTRPVILAVGQLKEKKGFRHLIDACAALRDRGYDVECRIIGEGPSRAALEAQISDLSLDDSVVLCGARDHDDVVAQYRSATIFALPCVTGADGDRDGIPNVILEAMAMRLPVVSTRHSGIPEAVVDGSTGLLVAPGDSDALTGALARLLDDPQTAEAMGRAGRDVVAAKFDIAANAKELMGMFSDVLT
jgi:glycosyltransferase involved in cell wall biosynthesis